MPSIDTSLFRPISLPDIEQVKLMNRTDTKYVATLEQVEQLIQRVHPYYYALTMNNTNQLPYSTTYYDTPDADMYSDHVRGKKNRYKIRHRTYQASNVHFMEVKFKSNKGRTIKKRITTNQAIESISPVEQLFLKTNTPFEPFELQPVLYNQFKRLTLVDKSFKERCTIDFSLQFCVNSQTAQLNELAIIELKTESRNKTSKLARALHTLRIKPTSFSKYCIGRTLTDQSVKSNAIRPQVYALNKLTIIT